MDFCGFAIKVMSLRWHWQGRRERAALRNANMWREGQLYKCDLPGFVKLLCLEIGPNKH